MTEQVKLSVTDARALTKSLESTLLVSAKARSVSSELFFQVEALRDNSDSTLNEFRELLKVIQAIPALQFFDQSYQYALGYRNKVDFYFLIGWLISRAQQVGAKQTIKDLTKYLVADTVRLTEILAIDGVKVTTEIKLGEYKLVDWSSITETDTKFQMRARGLFSVAFPDAAFIRQHIVPKTHLPKYPQSLPKSLEPVLDMLYCVTASVGEGIRIIHYWSEPEPWVPWKIIPHTFRIDSRSFYTPVELSSKMITQIRKCLSGFQTLDDNTKLRFRIPLDRLNRSYLARDSVGKAIELGIALESLYAPTKLSEGIANTIRIRAARFLGGSLEQRQKIVETLKDVYDIRSLAIHTGRFDAEGAKKKWRDDTVVSEVLKEGQRLVARSLIKMISKEEPKWEDFDIARS